MEKKYNLPLENEENTLHEPAIEYNYEAETEIVGSPPLTEEELKNAITGEELIEAVCKHIHELFNKK